MKSKEEIEARLALLREHIRRERSLRDRCAVQSQWWVIDRRMKALCHQADTLKWVLGLTEA